jgi:hypothetical protein
MYRWMLCITTVQIQVMLALGDGKISLLAVCYTASQLYVYDRITAPDIHTRAGKD